jgi:hypothetical protein
VEPTTTGAAATPMRPQASQPVPRLKGWPGLKLYSFCCATWGGYLGGGMQQQQIGLCQGHVLTVNAKLTYLLHN